MTSPGQKDLGRFYQELYRESYEAAEYDKAHALESDGWGGKSSRYVSVITLLAVALFLLGLSSLVPGSTRKAFVYMGGSVAAIGALWSFTVFLEGVKTPVPEAIDAFVEGVVELNHAEDAGELQRSVDLFTEAIGHRGDYTEAFFARGNALFGNDLRDPEGPQGSEQARDDFLSVMELGQTDANTWGNLGAAEFWLGDYQAAVDATEAALELAPDELVWNLNIVHGLIGIGSDEGYEQ